jgi:dipeptidase D
MLNLDTEEWNELYVGCAGGGGWELRREFATEPVAEAAEQWRLVLKGLAGGHSGVQIHEQLGNAIKLLGQCLCGVEGVQLGAIDVGVAHNVIPREGRVTFSCPAGLGEVVSARLAALRVDWLAYLPPADSSVELHLEPDRVGSVLGAGDSRRVLDLVAALPHGAQAYSLERPADLVEISINLAVLRLSAGHLFVEASYRFFNERQSEPLQQTVLALASAFGLEATPLAGYPGWQPDFDSPLLAQAGELHERLFGVRPAVKAIHAGLECGILKGKKPDMDILSFGPTIKGAHSPAERLQIDTVAPFWRFLRELLARM